VLERGVGHLPPVAAPSDDLMSRHAHVGEEHLVELGAAGHRLERPDRDARRLHREQQVADAGVLDRVGLGAHQAEDHVGFMRGGGPDLLAVDDEVVAVLDPARLQRGQVRPGIGLRIALAPGQLAAQRRGDVLLLLFFGAQLHQGGHEHRDALVADAHVDAGAAEFVDDQVLLHHVRRRAVAAVLPRHGAPGIAVLQQQPLPGQQGRSGPLAGYCRRRAVAVLGEEGAQAVAKDLVFGSQAQIHRVSSVCVRWADSWPPTADARRRFRRPRATRRVLE
jgi:hypothetical protein